MNDLAVSVKALGAGCCLLSEAGADSRGSEGTPRQLTGLDPGVELAYQVPFSYGLPLPLQGDSLKGDQYLELRPTLSSRLLAISPSTDRQLSPRLPSPPTARSSTPGPGAVPDRSNNGWRGAECRAVARWPLTSGSRSPGPSTSRPTTRSRIRWSAGGGVSSACSTRPPAKVGPPRWTISPPPWQPASPPCDAISPPCAARESRPSPEALATARHAERKVGGTSETPGRQRALMVCAVIGRHIKEDVCSGVSPYGPGCGHIPGCN